jgi:hypothetical protein
VPDPLWDANLFDVVAESRAGLEEAWREAVEP